MQRNARLTLVALIAACTLPFAASYVAFFVWPPKGTVNYGELIAPTPLPEGWLAAPAGHPAPGREAINGRWTLVYAGPAACGAVCGQVLYAMRQSRLAQGREMDRVERLWLVTDGDSPDAGLLREHGGLHVAQADAAWLAALPASEQGVHMFLVDPLGNVMMRFPQQPDVGLVIKDLKRLLKFSSVG